MPASSWRSWWVGIDREHGVPYAALGTAPAGSFPFPGSPKGLPYPYLAIHDVHHVIGGELQVLGFTIAPIAVPDGHRRSPPPADVRRDLNVLEASSETP